MSSSRLPRAFFARPAPLVAPDLLGRVLVRVSRRGVRTAATIVETEAYTEEDPASHSFRGRSARNEVMFGAPGLLYVYFTYGMHWCMNVVCGPEGRGEAVLFRAGEPMEGIAGMRRRRSVREERLLCSGPARLAEAFGVDRRWNGADLVRSAEIFLEPGVPVAPDEVVVSSRVGIRDGIEYPWRFAVAGSRYVSRAASVTASSVSGSRRPRASGARRPSPRS